MLKRLSRVAALATLLVPLSAGAQMQTVDEAKAAKPLADLEPKWGQQFIHGDFVIESVYETHALAAPADKGHGKRRGK